MRSNVPRPNVRTSARAPRPLRRRRSAPVVASVLQIAALAQLSCSEAIGPDRLRLLEQRELWDSQGLRDYSFEVQRLCFCPVRERVRVRVVDGAVAGAVDLGAGEELGGDEVRWYLSIDGLFDLLDDAYAQGAQRVEVDFHASRGHPTHLWIDYDEKIADEELGFTLLSDVEPRGGGSARASD